jgi:SHS2 domain-containing protein
MDEQPHARKPASVSFLDHTADVGFDVEAPTLEGLFVAAAHALNDLILGMDEPGAGEDTGERPGPAKQPASRDADLHFDAVDTAALLADWLRELVFLFETEAVLMRAVHFRQLDERRLHATVELGPPVRRPVREIKGVTYHGLDVRQTDGIWHARVILDV